MARGRRKKSKSKNKSGRKGRKSKGQIPLDVLEKRLGKLNAVVKRRGGSYY